MAGSDKLLIVAAPYSEPTRNSSAVAKEDNSYIGRGGSQGLASDKIFPSNELSLPSTSVSPGMSRRGSSLPLWEAGNLCELEHKRLFRGNTNDEETEQLHGPEEVVLKTKVSCKLNEGLI